MIPQRLVLATANRGKTAELAELLREWGTIDVLGLERFPGLTCPQERGATYAENAVSKATAVAVATGLPALADDSGLEVDALGGAPGIFSARYAGPGSSDAQRVAKLLAEVARVPVDRRSARFRCVVAMAATRSSGTLVPNPPTIAPTTIGRTRSAEASRARPMTN